MASIVEQSTEIRVNPTWPNRPEAAILANAQNN
jgi:hypothetical protein